MLDSSFTGSVTEVVTPHIGWDGNGHCVVDAGAGTDYSSLVDFISSTYKSPDVFPGITSMCEANTIHILVINCQTTITVIGNKCIWCLLLVANDLTTHTCILYTM